MSRFIDPARLSNGDGKTATSLSMEGPVGDEPKKMVCSICRGERVLRDAYAEWDKANQEWVLQNVFDYAVCENEGTGCPNYGEKTRIDEEPMTAEELAELQGKSGSPSPRSSQ